MLQISGKHPEKTDEELLGKYLAAGDLDVLGELYTRYMHMVYGVSLKYLENREEAKDAVMQIFEQLVTDLPRHRIRNFRSWLYVLTKNHCFMQLRAAKRMRGKLEAIKNEPAFMESGEELHPIDRADESIEDALRMCIGQLRSEQKQCIELFYDQKLCYKEISERMHMEEKKVKSHLQNGKRNLKICLEKKNVR
ncbi:MAG TPA: sigma-70 family RNA polymerase sigma factor [Bacteroides sp.]|nr:sigma-70 family RNA polymerase sigma factor [Bacteroides sp.]